MEIKNAMEIYFNKQREFWQTNFGTFTELSYHDKIDECMIIPDSLNNEGNIQWQPVLQITSIDFSELEKNLDLNIHHQIKQFFTSYWYLSLIGIIENTVLYFVSIPYGRDVLKLVKNAMI